MASFLIAQVAWLLLAISAGVAQSWSLDNKTSPTSQFHTRPDMSPPIIQPVFLDPEKAAPGYIFAAPYRNRDPGPYIYDDEGNLVWSGAADFGPTTAHMPHVCPYKGEDHICFFRGFQLNGFARGHGVILDKHYRIVKTVESAGATTPGDMHEFRLTDDGEHALITSYQPRQFDMSGFGIPSMGWIRDSIFQKIHIETGKLVFEWRSMDHETTSPLGSYVAPGATTTSGDGQTPSTAWDYFHINSIEPCGGDFLISARHMSAIFKISGEDGRVLWSLNGAWPSFTMQDDWSFSHQHDARLMMENGTHTLLTIFDNAGITGNVTHFESRGMVIGINHKTKVATLLQGLSAPQKIFEEGISAKSQGNMQTLPNGNLLIGWGDHAEWTEYTREGEPVSHSKLALFDSHVNNYRTHKFPWVGEPITSPKLWTFSRYGSSGGLGGEMALHASWNGATEVQQWALYTSKSPEGPWKQVTVTPKTGFETSVRVNGAWKWAYAEAMDKDGEVLGKSNVAQTFVPSEELAEIACDDMSCRTLKADELGTVPPLPPLDPNENFESSSLDRVTSFRHGGEKPDHKGKDQDTETTTVDAPRPDLVPVGETTKPGASWKDQQQQSWTKNQTEKAKQYLHNRYVLRSSMVVVVALCAVLAFFGLRSMGHFRRMSLPAMSWMRKDNSSEKPLMGGETV